MRDADYAELTRLRHLETNYATYVSLTCDTRDKRAAVARSILLTDTTVHPGCDVHALCRLVNDIAGDDRLYELYEPPADDEDEFALPQPTPAPPAKPTKQVTTSPWEQGGAQGFAYHCTCGLSHGGFASRPTAYRHAQEHARVCPGGDEPLPTRRSRP